MKKIILLICILLLTGCGIKYPELKDDGIVFETGEFIDVDDDDFMYSTIEYNGRTYMLYGTLKNHIKSRNIEECIGYIEYDNSTDNQTRVFTLKEDSNDNYLMVYYIGTTLMNQPDFYRAIDTREKEIKTPKYIESLNYSYWK